MPPKRKNKNEDDAEGCRPKIVGSNNHMALACELIEQDMPMINWSSDEAEFFQQTSVYSRVYRKAFLRGFALSKTLQRPHR